MNKSVPIDVSKIVRNIPLPDVTKAFDLLMEFKRENEQTNREIARYEAMKEVMITEITRKYDFYEKLFSTVFSERRKVIDKYFSIIDKGIQENNNELVLAGLTNLSNVVASSPFADIGNLKALIESNRMPEL